VLTWVSILKDADVCVVSWFVTSDIVKLIVLEAAVATLLYPFVIVKYILLVTVHSALVASIFVPLDTQLVAVLSAIEIILGNVIYSIAPTGTSFSV